MISEETDRGTVIITDHFLSYTHKAHIDTTDKEKVVNRGLTVELLCREVD